MMTRCQARDLHRGIFYGLVLAVPFWATVGWLILR